MDKFKEILDMVLGHMTQPWTRAFALVAVLVAVVMLSGCVTTSTDWEGCVELEDAHLCGDGNIETEYEEVVI